MRNVLKLCSMLTLLGLIVACNTPEARIKKNTEMFDGFPPDVQERVRQGKIAVGDTRDMVFIALGEPNRQYVRTTADGDAELWSYVDRDVRPERERVTGSFRVRDSQGRYRNVNESMWVSVDHYTEYERLRIELINGKVHAIETIKR
ncbi:MAG: hypothetical protein KJ626_11300 [Verrucomicrobia bacterium]|nr:hypothetical protein [Verrucomicrobiota bacterium]